MVIAVVLSMVSRDARVLAGEPVGGLGERVRVAIRQVIPAAAFARLMVAATIEGGPAAAFRSDHPGVMGGLNF